MTFHSYQRVLQEKNPGGIRFRLVPAANEMVARSADPDFRGNPAVHTSEKIMHNEFVPCMAMSAEL